MAHHDRAGQGEAPGGDAGLVDRGVLDGGRTRFRVWAPKPAMWGEDFAFYLERVPGCFFVLGVQPHDRESYPMLHNPAYDFTDAAVPVGIRMMTELAVRYLRRETA